jgi:hypothetical protein
MKFLGMQVSSWFGGVRRSRADKARVLRDEVSIGNIDDNATAAVAQDQSAKDATAKRQGNPPEQGGQG